MSALFLLWGIQRASRNTVGSERTSACPTSDEPSEARRARVRADMAGLTTPDPVEHRAEAQPRHSSATCATRYINTDDHDWHPVIRQVRKRKRTTTSPHLPSPPLPLAFLALLCLSWPKIDSIRPRNLVRAMRFRKTTAPWAKATPTTAAVF